MTENAILPIERIAEKIYLIRDEKVMLDSDLAELYEVPTKRLNEQVKRNIRRFPEDFMFQLTKEEFENLKSQIATSSWGGRRTMPYVFTELGVAMLSTHKDIARKIEEHDQHISNLYAYIEQILAQPEGKKKPIGYIWPKDDE